MIKTEIEAIASDAHFKDKTLSRGEYEGIEEFCEDLRSNYPLYRQQQLEWDSWGYIGVRIYEKKG